MPSKESIGVWGKILKILNRFPFFYIFPRVSVSKWLILTFIYRKMEANIYKYIPSKESSGVWGKILKIFNWFPFFDIFPRKMSVSDLFYLLIIERNEVNIHICLVRRVAGGGSAGIISHTKFFINILIFYIFPPVSVSKWAAEQSVCFASFLQSLIL